MKYSINRTGNPKPIYRGKGPCQDLELWLRLSRDKTIKFANLNKPLLKYRIHPDQVKGSRKAYKAAAYYLFKEAIKQKSILLLFGAVVAVLKIYLRSYK